MTKKYENSKFKDLEQELNLPTGSTPMTPSRIRKVETEIARKTNEIKVYAENPEKAGLVLSEQHGYHEIDLAKDTVDMPLEERVARGKEFCRLEAIEMYNTCKDAAEMLKTELMPGAPSSMWMAYSNLMKTLLECKKEIGLVYDKLEEEYKFMAIPEEMKGEDDKVKVSVDKLMDLAKSALESNKKMSIGEVVDVSTSEIIDD